MSIDTNNGAVFVASAYGEADAGIARGNLGYDAGDIALYPNAKFTWAASSGFGKIDSWPEESTYGVVRAPNTAVLPCVLI